MAFHVHAYFNWGIHNQIGGERKPSRPVEFSAVNLVRMLVEHSPKTQEIPFSFCPKIQVMDKEA